MLQVGELFATLSLDDSQFNDGLGNAEKGLGSLAKISAGALAGVGAMVGGVAMASVKGAMDAEKAFDQLQASTGATMEEMEELEDVAKQTFRSGFGESIEEVTADIGHIRRNLGELEEDSLRAITQGAKTIEELYGYGVDETSRAIGTMVKNFEGLSETDALDMIATGFKSGADYSGELLDTLSEYSPQFASMGLSAEQMMGVLSEGAKAGAWNLDKVGDAVKEFNIRAQEGSSNMRKTFEAIGLEGQRMMESVAKGGEEGQKAFQATLVALSLIEDPLERNRQGVELFGTQWEDLEDDVVVAMKNGMTGMEGFEGSMKNMTKVAQDNLGTKVTKIWREFTGIFTDGAGKTGGALNTLADGVLNNMDSIKSIINGAVSAVSKSFKWVQDKAIKPLSEAFSNNSSDISDTMTTLSESIEGILSDIKDIINIFINGAKKSWNEYGDEITHITKSVWKIISGVIKGAFGIIDGLLDVFIGAFTGDWSRMGKGLREIWDGLWGAIGDIFSGAIGILDGIFGNWRSGVIGWFTNIKDEAISIVNSLVRSLKNAFDFEWRLPDFKLPNIDVTMRKNSMGIPYPDFDVNWYAKGGVFDGPSVIGVGEAGREAVVPLEGSHMRPFAEEIAKQMGAPSHIATGASIDNDINITLNYSGSNHNDAYAMMDIIENELGDRIKYKMRSSGVK